MRDDEQKGLEEALTSIYRESSAAALAVSRVCDNELDRSGALLGRIRTASLKRDGYLQPKDY